MIPNNSVLYEALREASTDLHSTDNQNELTIFINGDKIRTDTPITSGFAQKIATAVADIQNIKKKWDYFSWNIEIYIDITVLFEMINNTRIVNNILWSPQKEVTFMIDSDWDNMNYWELWELLHNEESCYGFLEHVSHLWKNMLQDLMIKLHSSKIPDGISSVRQTTHFDWPEVKRESEKTKELRLRLWAPLQRDSVEDLTISQLYKLAMGEENLVRVTQYCILRYAAGLSFF